MPQAKSHLKELFRTPLGGKTRIGALRLDMNENADGLPEEFVRKILAEITPEHLAAYPEYDTVIERIADHNKIEPENICISNGSDGAIKYIFDAYVSAGDQVLLTDPTFAMYPVYCRMFDATPKMIPYREDFSFPVDEFIQSIDSDIRLAVLVNPNNPTGVAISRSDLSGIIQKCGDKDVLLIIDEAYFYYYDETAIEEVKRFDHIIVLRTFSKLCGLAAARLGYAAASPEIIQNLYRVRPTYDVNGFSVLLAENILQEPELIERAIASVREGKAFLLDQLKENGIEYRDGSANFVLIKVPGFCNELSDRLKMENVLVSSGFSQDFLKDYMRVTVGDLHGMRKFSDIFIPLYRQMYA